MSKKRTTYSSAFKTKLVLELLQNADTLAEIASKHNILPQNLVNWKKAFLANAEIAMEPSKAVKEYKKYTYKLRGLNINHANHVWSTDTPTSRLPVAWSIWRPSLIGTAKLCYHIGYPTPWILS